MTMMIERDCMITSLYAVGPATIEIGKYGLPLADARARFVDTCEHHGAKIRKINETPNRVEVHLEWASSALCDLLCDIAIVEDLNGDPPTTYILRTDGVAVGEYVKTGTYND